MSCTQREVTIAKSVQRGWNLPRELTPNRDFFRNEMAGFKFNREMLEPKMGTVLQRSAL